MSPRVPGEGELGQAGLISPPSYLNEGLPADADVGEGMRVLMRRIEGLTAKGLLRKPFLFQCPPTESIRIGYAYNHEEYQTVGSGTFSRPAGRQLYQVAFGTLLVDYKPRWSLLDPFDERERFVPNPLLMRDELVEILESGTPFRLACHQAVYWHGKYDVNWPATLRSLNVDERAGEIGTRYLDVSFTEFRDPTVQRRAKGHARKGPPKGGGAAGHRLPATVELRADGSGRGGGHAFAGPVTMYSLARYFYGSPSRWRSIAQRNGLDVAPARPLYQPPAYPAPARIRHAPKVIVPRLG